MNPQQPFQPPATPQWPGAGPYPGPFPRRPSGATGVLGGIFAVLAALVLAAATIWMLIDVGDGIDFVLGQTTLLILLILQGIATVLLLAGGALLCLRVGLGRFLIPAGAVVVLAIVLVAVLQKWPFGAVVRTMTVAPLHVQDTVWLTLLFALAGSLLGLLPSTARWVSTLRT